ncbi:MAG: arsenate reductase ArsC [Myxococcales bacterium]|nr:arsenate reductase ArsC [Myxococcales bacterium]
MNVLILCTGNSCRSILGEALLNELGEGRFRAFSAGSRPVGKVNRDALATLARHGLGAAGYASKSWSAFDSGQIDLVISVCDSAAAEICPASLAGAARAHWGLPDPARVEGAPADIEAAFEETFRALERRVRRLVSLPVETMMMPTLVQAVNAIGAE